MPKPLFLGLTNYSPSSLQGNETNTHSLEGKLGSSLYYQRTVVLACTTVSIINAGASDPNT